MDKNASCHYDNRLACLCKIEPVIKHNRKCGFQRAFNPPICVGNFGGLPFAASSVLTVFSEQTFLPEKMKFLTAATPFVISLQVSALFTGGLFLEILRVFYIKHNILDTPGNNTLNIEYIV